MRLVRYRVGEAGPSWGVISDGTIMAMPRRAASRASIRPLTFEACGTATALTGPGRCWRDLEREWLGRELGVMVVGCAVSWGSGPSPRIPFRFHLPRRIVRDLFGHTAHRQRSPIALRHDVPNAASPDVGKAQSPVEIPVVHLPHGGICDSVHAVSGSANTFGTGKGTSCNGSGRDNRHPSPHWVCCQVLWSTRQGAY